jgi:uncharacterized protein (DUF302 family)
MPIRTPFPLAIAVLAATIAALLATHATSETAAPKPEGSGIVEVRSAYPFDETVARLRKDIADKGIMFFGAVDQSRLAADAGIALRPSTLLMFGNPPLGTTFITAQASAGLDWPVRLLVSQDEAGTVWARYTDFDWIARRHRITSRAAEFKMAASVIASITSSVKAK